MAPRKQTPRRRAPRSLTARSADRHALYELSVQQPLVMLEFIERMAQAMDARTPRVVREDFCGTAQLAALWVRSDESRRAVAIDNDPAIIGYAKKHSHDPLGDAAHRLTLIHDDVRRAPHKADVLVSLNFSHFIFKTRPDLLAYLRHARRCLRPGGIVVMDLYAGPGAMAPCCDKRSYGDFDYVWEQASYDPVTSDVVNHIHFRFPDGSQIKRAFTYHWRLWTLVELRELLEEAGFTEISVAFESEEGFTDDIDPADTYAWVAYLTAKR